MLTSIKSLDFNGDKTVEEQLNAKSSAMTQRFLVKAKSTYYVTES